MLRFVAMSGDEIRTAGGAGDGDFPFRAAADGADFFSLGGAESGGFSVLTTRARHGISLQFTTGEAEYAVGTRNTKYEPFSDAPHPSLCKHELDVPSGRFGRNQ